MVKTLLSRNPKWPLSVFNRTQEYSASSSCVSCLAPLPLMYFSVKQIQDGGKQNKPGFKSPLINQLRQGHEIQDPSYYSLLLASWESATGGGSQHKWICKGNSGDHFQLGLWTCIKEDRTSQNSNQSQRLEFRVIAIHWIDWPMYVYTSSFKKFVCILLFSNFRCGQAFFKISF